MSAAPSDRRGLVGLLGAVGASLLGTRMSFVALPWFVLVSTGSATRTGVVAFAEMAPYVAVQALGGPLVDRTGLRRAAVAGDLVAAAAMGAVPLLHEAGLLHLAALAALVAVVGAARGGGDVARDVMVPWVGGDAGLALERASGLYDGVSRLATLVGAPLAGVLVAVSSPLAVLGIDAVTFAVSAALIAGLVPASVERPSSEPASERSYLSSLGEGFRYLRGDRLLLGIATMVLVTNFVDQAAGAVLSPVWAREVAHSAVALGLLGAAFGLGAVLGNAVTTWLGPSLPRRLGYGVGFLLAGAPRFLAMAFAGLVPVLGVTFAAGLGAGGINPILGAVEYERVPRHLQARVLGAVGASAWAGIPLGGLAGGAFVTAFGLRAALLTAAAVYGLATLSPFVFPAWRMMERGAAAEGRPPAAGS